MNEIVIGLGIANLLGLLLLWRHIDKRDTAHTDLASRVTRIEANQANGLTAQQIHAIYADVAEIKGRLATSVDMMKTIQEHLLERDE